MKINDLVEFNGDYFLILSDPFVLEGRGDNPSLQVIKVIDLSNETIGLLRIEKNRIKNRVNSWGYVSYFQKLSESFIREFQNKVNWVFISGCQKLSESFIIEFQNKVHWDHIFNNENISKEIKEKFRLEGKFYD